MTDNEKFAELLEWEWVEALDGWMTKEGATLEDMVFKRDFDPRTKIEQAFMVVDAMGCDYELWKHGGQYRLALMSEEPSLGPQATTPQEAICKAVLVAKGGIEDISNTIGFDDGMDD